MTYLYLSSKIHDISFFPTNRNKSLKKYLREVLDACIKTLPTVVRFHFVTLDLFLTTYCDLRILLF